MLPELDQINFKEFFPKKFLSYDTPKGDYSINGYLLFKTILSQYGELPFLNFNISDIIKIDKNFDSRKADNEFYLKHNCPLEEWLNRKTLIVILESFMVRYGKHISNKIFDYYNESAYNKAIKLCSFSLFDEVEENQEKISLFKKNLSKFCDYPTLLKFYQDNPVYAARTSFCFKYIDVKILFEQQEVRNANAIVYDEEMYAKIYPKLREKVSTTKTYKVESPPNEKTTVSLKLMINTPEQVYHPAKFLDEILHLEKEVIKYVKESFVQARTKVGDPKRVILSYIQMQWGEDPILNTEKQKKLRDYLNRKKYKTKDEGHISALKRYHIMYEYKPEAKTEEWIPIQIHFGNTFVV